MLTRRRAAAVLVPLLGAAGWEFERRRDRRHVAMDPQTRELSAPIVGRPVEVRSADGTRLHAEVFGPDDAPTIVLVHGWTCQIGFWHYQLRELSQEFRVVAYDQRGHGRSDAPSTKAYDGDALADDLQAVLDACLPAGERCVLVGHSMGGMTVVAWAGRHPVAVPKLVAGSVLVNTGMGEVISHLLVLHLGSTVHTLVTGRLIGLAIPLPRTPTPVSRRLIRHSALSPQATPGQVAFCERMFLECPAAARAGFGRYLASFDLDEAVPALAVPTVVVVGDQDRLTPTWHARRLAAKLPDLVEMAVLPGIGHMAPIEASDEVTRRILDLARTCLNGAGAIAPPAAAARG